SRSPNRLKTPLGSRAVARAEWIPAAHHSGAACAARLLAPSVADRNPIADVEAASALLADV
ncbi:hypothetical protein, partial [Streptomyces sp. NPDC002851]